MHHNAIPLPMPRVVPSRFKDNSLQFKQITDKPAPIWNPQCEACRGAPEREGDLSAGQKFLITAGVLIAAVTLYVIFLKLRRYLAQRKLNANQTANEYKGNSRTKHSKQARVSTALASENQNAISSAATGSTAVALASATVAQMNPPAPASISKESRAPRETKKEIRTREILQALEENREKRKKPEKPKLLRNTSMTIDKEVTPSIVPVTTLPVESQEQSRLLRIIEEIRGEKESEKTGHHLV